MGVREDFDVATHPISFFETGYLRSHLNDHPGSVSTDDFWIGGDSEFVGDRLPVEWIQPDMCRFDQDLVDRWRGYRMGGRELPSFLSCFGKPSQNSALSDRNGHDFCCFSRA